MKYNVFLLTFFIYSLVTIPMEPGKSRLGYDEDDEYLGYEADFDSGSESDDNIGLILKDRKEESFDWCDQACQCIITSLWLITAPCRGYRSPLHYPSFNSMSKYDVFNFLCGYKSNKNAMPKKSF